MFEIRARVVLGLLVFSMFFLYQMNRFNISLAIVAIAHAECTAANSTSSAWDNKPLLLGAFFWISWITELSGAYLVGRFGCRNVLTVAYLSNGICSLLFPVAYHLHPICAVVIRMMQGFVLGVTWPAVGWISARWIPKSERSRFLSAFHGSSLGACVTNLLGGVIIHSYGWSYLFYLSGTLCILWVFLFRYNVYNRPAEHPRIADEERAYLDKYVEPVTNDNNKAASQSAPWLTIFRSVPFWSVCSVFFSMLWFNVTLALQLPSYLDMVHAIHIRTNGYLLSMPEIGKVLIGLTFPVLTDHLVRKRTITLATARKVSNAVGMGVPGILLVLLGLYGYTSVALTTVLIILIIGISGAASASTIANIVDLSPNHSGSLMGFVKTIGNIPGILSPIMIQYILAGEAANWRLVFFITSILVLSSCIFYVFFISVEIQPWNYQAEKEEQVNCTAENHEGVPIVKVTGTQNGSGQQNESFRYIVNEDMLAERMISGDKDPHSTDSS